MHPSLIPALVGLVLSTDALPTGPSIPPAIPATKTSSPCVAHVSEVPGMDPTHARLHAPHLIVVQKAARRVQVFSRGTAVAGSGEGGKACYRIGLGFAPAAHKKREGDGRTPEGWYTTSDKPWSSAHSQCDARRPVLRHGE